MSDEELFKKVSPIGAILKEVFKEEFETQDRVINELIKQSRKEVEHIKEIKE